MSRSTRNRLKLGEILVEAGVIDEMQLASALGEQSRWGRRLGVTLVKLGMVEEVHLIRALATQLGLPVASLAGKRIADDVVALVPARIASEHGVMPLFKKREGTKTQLFVGMEDPSNLAVLDDLGFLTGMEIHPVMIGPTELGEAIDRYYLVGGVAPANRRPEPNEMLGERNLRSLVDTETADEGADSQAAAASDAVAAAPSRDRSIDLDETVEKPPVNELPDGLLDDIANALEDSQKSRVVVRAIVQILIEKGIVTLEEVQTQVARQKDAPPA
jgi:hypothetical protein